MRIVGDIVGDRRALGLDAGIAPQLQIVDLVEVGDRARHLAGKAPSLAVGQRPVVLDQALKGFPGEIEAVELGVAALQPGDDAQRLGVVVETAPAGHLRAQGILARVPERRVSEIVDQRDALGQILVAIERTGERAGDLRDLDGMGEPGPVMVALMGDEDLGLVLHAAEGGGMDDAVAVALERRAGRALGLPVLAAAASGRVARIGGARPVAETDVPHG